MFFVSVIPISASEAPVLSADASILIDADNGSILYESNANEVHGIASITKVMSVYVALEEMKEQDLSLDSIATISKRATKLKENGTDISGGTYSVGEELTYEELIDLSLIYSDNTAVIALGENLSGSEKEHVAKMNAQAKAWGMESTTFYNVSGLTMYDYGDIAVEGTKSTDYNTSTAREVALMAKNVIAAYPELLEVTAQPSIDLHGETLYSWNLMLPEGTHAYEGVTGLKTGHSDEAGYGFLGYYTSKDKHYISVVLGADDMDARFTETAKLYTWIDKQDVKNVYSPEDQFSWNIDGAMNGEISLHPKSSLDTVSESGVNMFLESVEYNETYFTNARMVKDVPAGEIILTLNFKKLDENNSAATINDVDDYIGIELVSDKDINYEGKLMSSTFDFLNYINGFIKSVF